jgi:heptosyltransferase-2
VALSDLICRPPFAAAIPNDLQREYRSLPLRRRAALLRKAWSRELWLKLNGQGRLRTGEIPADARRILWIYSWTTIGDAIMDLSQCALLPPQAEIDLCIAPHLADLFQGDARFAHVFRSVDECTGNYDFILLHNATTALLQTKRRRFPDVPFDSVFGQLSGECFSRMDFVAQRLGQLLSLPVPMPAPPALLLDDIAPTLRDGFRIAVALGGRDPRRSGAPWPAILPAIVEAWPKGAPAPVFVLTGDPTAMTDLAALPREFVERHAEILVDRTSLRATAAAIRDCDAFIGPDGGLMHIALAFGKPGLALFNCIRPEWRMHGGACMNVFFSDAPLSAFAADKIAHRFMSALAPLLVPVVSGTRELQRGAPSRFIGAASST